MSFDYSSLKKKQNIFYESQQYWFKPKLRMTMKSFQDKGVNIISKYKISRILDQILCCRNSLESPRRDDSVDYPQHRVWKRTNGLKMSSFL